MRGALGRIRTSEGDASVRQTYMLACWKQIAEYLDQGVRTVQRYEGRMGLPRLPPGYGKGVVLASPMKLMYGCAPDFESGGNPSLDVLRKELPKAVTFIPLGGIDDVEHWTDDDRRPAPPCSANPSPLRPR